MNEHDDITDRLTRSLTDHTDVMSRSHVGLAEVQGRARSIRRRRTATAVVGVAAAVGLLVPTVALASHTRGKAEPAPAIQTTRTPTPTPSTPSATATDVGQPAQGVLDVSHLPTGAAPAMEYVHDRTLYFRDGGSATVPTRYQPYAFAQLDDGTRVWLTTKSGTPYVEIQDDGGVHAPIRSGWSLVVNPVHTAVAWLTPSNQVMLFEGRATQPRAYGDPLPAEPRLVAISGNDCSLACTVYANAPDEAKGFLPWEVTDAGSRVMTDGSYATLKDVSAGGLFAGETKVTQTGSCSKVSGGGEFQGFDTCRSSFVAFSPDGQLVLGQPPYSSGAGATSLTLFTVTGKTLFSRAADEQHQSYVPVPGPVWEDDTHLVTPVFQGGDWSLVRFAPDGSMEYAVPPVAGPYEHSPYLLPTGGDLGSIG